MQSYTDKDNESTGNRFQAPQGHVPAQQLIDNRASTATQNKLIVGINSSQKQVAQREQIQGQFSNAMQLQAEDEESLQGKFSEESVQRQTDVQPNNTGLPDNLKSGIENLSGYSMDDVKVHYNSDKPSQLQAHAYAQGSDIHLASGQEKHLPHEAWHVVQQKQGRVKPTMQMKQGVSVNDDAGLEKEADVMGAKAVAAVPLRQQSVSDSRIETRTADTQLVQRVARSQSVDLASAGLGDNRHMVLVGGGGGAAPVDNSVGIAHALGTDGWGGVALAPAAEFWRAHALAEVLGGAGDNTNVGWWTKDDEDAWTPFEERVQGRKAAGFDPDYRPYVTEEGTYTVNSNNFQLDPKPNYVAEITATVNEINNANLNFVGVALDNGLPGSEANVDWAAVRDDARAVLLAAAQLRINPWLDYIFTNTVGGVWAWTSLQGTYSRTKGAGGGKGQKRVKDMTFTQTPAPILAGDFGIAGGSAANLWPLMANANDGVYGRGQNPFNALTRERNVNTLVPVELYSRFRFSIGGYQTINIDFAL